MSRKALLLKVIGDVVGQRERLPHLGRNDATVRNLDAWLQRNAPNVRKKRLGK